jgi:hypothetical protein
MKGLQAAVNRSLEASLAGGCLRPAPATTHHYTPRHRLVNAVCPPPGIAREHRIPPVRVRAVPKRWWLKLRRLGRGLGGEPTPQPEGLAKEQRTHKKPSRRHHRHGGPPTWCSRTGN